MGDGSFSVNCTVCSSTAVTPNSSSGTRTPLASVPAKKATLLLLGWLIASFAISLAVNTTSFAVTGSPSCHLAFSLSLKVRILPVSSSCPHSVAKRGSCSPFAFTTMSLSYINSRTASVLPFVVLKGINVSQGAVIAIVTVEEPSAFPSSFPAAADSPAAELSLAAA